MAKVGITEVALRDGHQSLLATRLRTDDLLQVCSALDEVGYWSVETWGGATYDACLRFLGECPWERLRRIKAAMPKTRQQMLLRGQNLVGYRPYGNDIIRRFVELAVSAGVDVFRVFDAMNDPRNLSGPLRAVREHGGHAQGTMSYTTSEVHNLARWVDLAKRIEDIGVDSLCIKDMAGLLRPYDAFELVSALVEAVSIPIHMQCHATTGFSTATAVKAIEAGLSNVDTSVSTMSMTYGHSPTETMIRILDGTEYDTGLDYTTLMKPAEVLKQLRHRYRAFEGSLRGVDARIIHAQVPGGMLSNLENQLRQQRASERLGEVLEEVPKVRADFGMIPLVTPTSQIVGTQAVINVLSGERYQRLTKESAAVLRGEYGAWPADPDRALRDRALAETDGKVAVFPPPDELHALRDQFDQVCRDDGVSDKQSDEMLLSYAQFPQVVRDFLKADGDPSAFETPPPVVEDKGDSRFTMTVDGQAYDVALSDAGAVSSVIPASTGAVQIANPAMPMPVQPVASANATSVDAPMSGQIVRIEVAVGGQVAEGTCLLVLEAMKMEVPVAAPIHGTVVSINIAPGQRVESGDSLATIG